MLLESVFERRHNCVRVVGRLVNSQEQIASRVRVAYNEAWVEWARRGPRVRGVREQDRCRAARHSIYYWRSVGYGTHASHVRSHRRGLIVPVIPLLIAIFDSWRKIFCELVLENHGKIVEAAGRLGVVHCRTGASQNEYVWTGYNRWISQKMAENVGFGSG